MKPCDLAETDRLLELHRQAVAVGLAHGGEAGQLEFLSLANRARVRGRQPGALLVWLLTHEKADFITTADEEAARRRLREHRDGPDVRAGQTASGGRARQLSPDEHVVEVSIRVARQQGIQDPFRIAQQVKGWTRARWNEAHVSYRATQEQQWCTADDVPMVAFA